MQNSEYQGGGGQDQNYASDDSELGNFNPNRNAHKHDTSDSNVKAGENSSSWSQSMMNNSAALQQHRQQSAKLELINTQNAKIANNQTVGSSLINPLGGSSSDMTGLAITRALNVTNDGAPRENHTLELKKEPGPINDDSSENSRAENQFVFKND